MEPVNQILNVEAVKEGIEMEKEDICDTIAQLNGTIANCKLKLQDFGKFVKIMETEKTDRVRKNNEKITVIAKMIMSEMTEMYDKMLIDLSGNDETEIDSKKKILWETTESTALNIIEKLKFIYNDGTSVLNDE